MKTNIMPDFILSITYDMTMKQARIAGAVGASKYAYHAIDNTVQRTAKMPPTLLEEITHELLCSDTQGNPKIVIVRYQLHRSLTSDAIPPKNWESIIEDNLAKWLIDHSFMLDNQTFISKKVNPDG